MIKRTEKIDRFLAGKSPEVAPEIDPDFREDARFQQKIYQVFEDRALKNELKQTARLYKQNQLINRTLACFSFLLLVALSLLFWQKNNRTKNEKRQTGRTPVPFSETEKRSIFNSKNEAVIIGEKPDENRSELKVFLPALEVRSLPREVFNASDPLAFLRRLARLTPESEENHRLLDTILVRADQQKLDETLKNFRSQNDGLLAAGPETVPLPEDALDFHLTSNGNLLVFSRISEGSAYSDLWFMQKINGKWSRPQIFGPEINSPAREFSPTISDDGNRLIFQRRPNAVGADWLYISQKTESGWSPARKMSESINFCYTFDPHLLPDGRTLIFGLLRRTGSGFYFACLDESGNPIDVQEIRAVNSNKDSPRKLIFSAGSFYFLSGKKLKAYTLSGEKREQNILFNPAENRSLTFAYQDFSYDYKSGLNEKGEVKFEQLVRFKTGRPNAVITLVFKADSEKEVRFEAEILREEWAKTGFPETDLKLQYLPAERFVFGSDKNQFNEFRFVLRDKNLNLIN